jgi:predicted phosphodiesterase
MAAPKKKKKTLKSKLETAENPELIRARGEIQRLKDETASLRRIMGALDRSNWSEPRTLPSTKKVPVGKKKSFLRVVLSDSHGSYLDREIWKHVYTDICSLQPSSIVLLGDHVDCSGFLSRHHTLGFLSEGTYSYEEDISAANGFLDDIQKACPGAEIHYMEGNHEDRIERWVMTVVNRSQQDAEFLRKQVSPEYLLELEKRGIKYYRRGVFHMGFQVGGLIKLGKCLFAHEGSRGQNAAMKMLNIYATNIVFGHTHRQDSAVTYKPGVGQISAHNPGCLRNRQPTWYDKVPTGWSQGYAVQLVRDDGSFLHVNVPVDEGGSLLASFTDKLR